MPGLRRSRGGPRFEQMVNQADEYAVSGSPVPRIASDDGNPGPEGEGATQVLLLVSEGAVEFVDRDQESDAPRFEEVDRREAVLEPAGVGQHDRAHRAVRQFVPHEPEAVLP